MATTFDGRARERAARGRGSRPLLVLGAVAMLFAVLAYLSIAYGARTLSPSQVWSGLTRESDLLNHTIIWQIRLPRLVDGMLVGAALAVAGCLLQGVTRNPLADPTILGITAAAGLASSTAMVIEPTIPAWGMAAACMGGGLVGAGLLFFIAWRGQISPIRLALAGVALSAFFGAAIVALLSSSRTFLQTSLGFLAGGLYGADWRDFRATAVYILPGIAGAFLLAGRLNVLALGDDVAAGLGILTDRTRVAILVVCGVLTAAAVAIAGLVSFVGLVCPHLARFAVGNDNRRLIPASALIGATLVAAADLAARVVISPSEIPMGIITAGVGAPFLLYLVKFRGMKLEVESLTLEYAGSRAVDAVSLVVESGEMVAIVGPNGSGKSTLLRGMSRLQKPAGGRVLLDGRDIRRMAAREVARDLAILTQSPEAGLDLTVRELVWRGRYPHQGILQRPSAPDFEAVEWAMDAADVGPLAARALGALSGGERQRAWIALALAQQPKVMLLDEPTSFLDIRHQVEVMHLLRRLNHQGMTIVAVLHDLLLAGRFADRVIALTNGRIAFDGPPATVLEPAALEAVFGLPMMVIPDPESGQPIALPRPDPALCAAARPAAR